MSTKQKRITLTQSQCSVIYSRLRSDDMKLPFEEFVADIMKETDAEQWVVEKLVENWRYWHPDGAAGGLRDAAEDEKRNNEFMLVKQPLPRPKVNGSASNPEDGSGKVAQILKLAAEGKSVKEIIEMGYNKSTVYRQVSEWKKRKAAPKEEEVAA